MGSKTPVNPKSIGELLLCKEHGTPVTGVVTEVKDYGVTVDLGLPVNALLHLTDIDWRRVGHPRDHYTVGDTVTAVVLQFDRHHRRVSLGVKQLTADPIESLNIEGLVGKIVDATVTAVTDYGLFCEIHPGVEGLVHVSELSWINRNIKPGTVAVVGDDVKVVVTEFSASGRRISLSVKRACPNPWEEFDRQWRPGDILSGKIFSITDFGVFVKLQGGIDGLIPMAYLGGGIPARGSVVEVVLESVNVGKERIVFRPVKI